MATKTKAKIPAAKRAPLDLSGVRNAAQVQPARLIDPADLPPGVRTVPVIRNGMSREEIDAECRRVAAAYGVTLE
jgi:hypothetical protein